MQACVVIPGAQQGLPDFKINNSETVLDKIMKQAVCLFWKPKKSDKMVSKPVINFVHRQIPKQYTLKHRVINLSTKGNEGSHVSRTTTYFLIPFKTGDNIVTGGTLFKRYYHLNRNPMSTRGNFESQIKVARDPAARTIFKLFQKIQRTGNVADELVGNVGPR